MRLAHLGEAAAVDGLHERRRAALGAIGSPPRKEPLMHLVEESLAGGRDGRREGAGRSHDILRPKAMRLDHCGGWVGRHDRRCGEGGGEGGGGGVSASQKPEHRRNSR